MKKWLLSIIAACLLVLPAVAQRGGGHGGHSSHSSRSSSKSSSRKTVHVREYTRKDGTVVHAHDRAAPGYGDHSGSPSRASYRPYRRNYAAEGYTLHSSVQRDSHGKIKRSTAARSAFMRGHPCPSTGRTSGRCPGYVVDHVRALECGGLDDPSNMQWQTVADGRAKDRTERYCR